MVGLLEAVVGVGGMIIPPAFDFIKKKFLSPEEDTPEATLSSLATTKPEVMPDYLRATVEYKDANVRWYNRDVIGTPSQWVIDLRASIRPVTVVASLLMLGLEMGGGLALDPGTRACLCGNVGQWLGSRVVK